MTYRYHAIRDACAFFARKHRRPQMMYAQPIESIMKTPWQQGYGIGVYEYPKGTYIHLSHIDEWDYDMLLAFGVPTITKEFFHHLNYQRLTVTVMPSL